MPAQDLEPFDTVRRLVNLSAQLFQDRDHTLAEQGIVIHHHPHAGWIPVILIQIFRHRDQVPC